MTIDQEFILRTVKPWMAKHKDCASVKEMTPAQLEWIAHRHLSLGATKEK